MTAAVDGPVLTSCLDPLVSVWLDDDDPMYDEGPWRVLRKAALRAGWSVDGLFSRGNTLTATGGVGGLTDAVSLRMRIGTPGANLRTRYAVALWTRTTWPTLGRGRKDDDGRQGEGRASTAGKTWLWHPPMALPVDGAPACPWKFDQGWSWSSADRVVVRRSATEVRMLLTK